jgi:enediyne biosynthesis protein E4
MTKHLIIAIFSLLHVGLLSYGQSGKTLFDLVSPDRSGIRFTNAIVESDSLHVFKYEYLYNGHGIGVADFNRDGLDDVFISGNVVANKLYLNKGSLRFEDITVKAKIEGNGHWRTGVNVADVNGDSWPDIYICHSGPVQGIALSNELYIHQGLKNGVPQFREMAAEFGLDAPGSLSTQSAFFDFDRDGDLDLFLVNHSNHTFNPYLNTSKIRATPDMRFGNRLFRNDAQTDGTPRFVDITLTAGIINNALNFGLSVVISDLNKDGWPDIYSSSDYTEQDYCYVNNKNGTFTQVLQKSFTHISKFSMGADIADINNDGWPDVYTLDMLPADNYRQKLLKGPDEYDAYHLLLDSGYYHQQMRNMLHLHQGIDQQGNMRFSEIGQLAGISNTDWSWSALFSDFDNDGWKDLMVSNGYLRDFTDNDFLKYTVADEQLAQASKGNLNFKTYDLVRKMPSNKLRNFFFRNEGDLTFSNKSLEWGFNNATISNCAAYADFDNDGDMDLIIGNNNEPVQLYENKANELVRKNYLQIRLKGSGNNTQAIGAKVYVYAKSAPVQLQELFPVRGYQSSSTHTLHFGLGDAATIDSVRIQWPDGSLRTETSVTMNSRIDIEQRAKALHTGSSYVATPDISSNTTSTPRFKDVTAASKLGFTHRENDFVDFKVEVLIPYQLSRSGPALATGDVNGDGLSDVFLGGAIGQPGSLFLQQKDGTFSRAGSQPWEADKESEDIRAVMADFNGDNHLDLYVVSGGNEYVNGSPEYADRIYLNDGRAGFARSPNALPQGMTSSKQAITVGDMDGDGDIDLFVGGSAVPGGFPHASRSYLLRNDSRNGAIEFTDVTGAWSKELETPGMISSAAFSDMDADGKIDLIIAGEWMSVRLFMNTGGSFKEVSNTSGLSDEGLWSALFVGDVNGDGKPDIVAGNAGDNLQFKTSKKEPVNLFVTDIDDNGMEDPLFCYYINGISYPAASRDELLDQVVPLRRKFVKYHQYANAGIADIVPDAKRKSALQWNVTELSTVAYINKGDNSFQKQVLPPYAQVSRTFSINDLGEQGLLMTGNFYPWRVQWGRSDAGLGSLVHFNKDGVADVRPAIETGLYIGGDVRQTAIIKNASGRRLIIVAKNDEPVQVLEILE